MPKGTPKKAGGANGGVTKWDAVKESLADLGNDAMPLAIRDHIKTKFGIDMDPNLISNYKSSLLKKNGGKKKGGKKKGRPAGASARTTAAGGLSVDDIKTVQRLVDRLGSDKVRELTQVLAR